jgi:hypothetical protein
MSDLVSYAERELDLANVEEPERTALLRMVELFAEVSDSGGQASALIAILSRLLSWQPLTALSSDPREWLQVSNEPCWQSTRRPTTFSRDQGKTWYDIEDSSLNNGDVWDRDSANWIEIQIGNNVKVGSLVRAKVDAYSVGSAASINGVPGRVTAIRNGMIAVQHDNGKGYNHMPEVLQVAKT